eukprot:319650-Hanusia_phi.AAC.1
MAPTALPLCFSHTLPCIQPRASAFHAPSLLAPPCPSSPLLSPRRACRAQTRIRPGAGAQGDVPEVMLPSAAPLSRSPHAALTLPSRSRRHAWN